jgi:hypothetical protein
MLRVACLRCNLVCPEIWKPFANLSIIIVPLNDMRFHWFVVKHQSLAVALS